MTTQQRILALILVLLVGELTAYEKLRHFLEWTNPLWLAASTAFVFIVLLLGSVIAMSSGVPTRTRRGVYVGGCWLFGVQALSSVLISYQYGLTALPLQVVTDFFGIEAGVALKSMAIIQGATLSIVSLTFWNVVSALMRAHAEEQEEKHRSLQSLEQLMQDMQTYGHPQQERTGNHDA